METGQSGFNDTHTERFLMPREFDFDIRIYGANNSLDEISKELVSGGWKSDRRGIYRLSDSVLHIHDLIVTHGEYPYAPLEAAMAWSEKYKDVAIECSSYDWGDGDFSDFNENTPDGCDYPDCSHLHTCFIANGKELYVCEPEEKIYTLGNTTGDSVSAKDCLYTFGEFEQEQKMRDVEASIQTSTCWYWLKREAFEGRLWYGQDTVNDENPEGMKGELLSPFRDRVIKSKESRAEYLSKLSFFEIQTLRLQQLRLIQHSYVKEAISPCFNERPYINSHTRRIEALYSLAVYLFYATPTWADIRETTTPEAGKYGMECLSKALGLLKSDATWTPRIYDHYEKTEDVRSAYVRFTKNNMLFSLLWGLAKLEKITPGEKHSTVYWKQRLFNFWKSYFDTNLPPNFLLDPYVPY